MRVESKVVYVRHVEPQGEHCQRKGPEKGLLLRINEAELDIKSFREEEDHVIKQYEALMLDIIEETLRPTERVLQTAIVESYSVSQKDGKAIARGLHGAFKSQEAKSRVLAVGKDLCHQRGGWSNGSKNYLEQVPLRSLRQPRQQSKWCLLRSLRRITALFAESGLKGKGR